MLYASRIVDRPPLTPAAIAWNGPITLIGDASHPVTPASGQGGDVLLHMFQPVLKANMVSAFENTKQYIAFDCNFQSQLGTLHSGANLALEDAADLAAFLAPTSEAW